MKKRFLVLILAVGMLLLAGCGTDGIDISGYAENALILSGVNEEDIVLTIDDLKAMDCETIKAESTSDKIGEVRATGVWLDTILEQYGCKQEDFSKIRFYGTDEYDVNLYTDYLKEHPIMLAFGIDGEPLDAESIPLRVIIRDSDSAYWVRMVTKIDFEK